MRHILITLALLFGVASTVMTVAATHLRNTAHTAKPAVKLAGTVVWPAGTRPAPGFALRDQNGQIISRTSLRGRVWAITFIDSKCTASCPIVARELALAQRTLGRTNPLEVIAVSTLPQYDTPTHVRAFAHKLGLTGNWHWLLGTHAQLAPVWQAYGIWVRTGITHDIAVYIVDTHGDVRIADAMPIRPGQVASSVRALERTAIAVPAR